MQINEFSKPLSSVALNENAAKKFGYKLNLEQFSDVQLEDARNKLRTQLSQFEMSESFDSVHSSNKYQKTRMFLDVINQEIMERDEGKCEDCHKDPCECDDEHDDEEHDHKKDMKKEKKNESVNQYKAAVIGQRAKGFSVPQSWINSAIDRMQLGESDNAELKAELAVRYDLTESQASYILAEGEETKAEIIMATKDMVDRITGWLEDVAGMKAEQLLELLDSIRENMGSDVAEQYSQAIKPALENIYSTLESTRQSLSQGLSLVSGGEAPTSMGAPSADMSMPDLGDGSDMGAPEEAPMAEPGAEAGSEAGRMKRESVDYSRRLSQIINTPKKK